MKVEIWSDIVCPWCAIGKARFDQALEGFAHRDDVEVVWRSFELDPSAPHEMTGPLAEHLAAKYGVSVDDAIGMQQHMTNVAAAEGLTFRFDIARSGNTFDAHRLLHLAAERGLQHELNERLLRAYLAEGEPIADRPTLARLAAQVGLDEAEAAGVLDGDGYADAVRADEAQARAYGISGVPFFVIDGAYGVSGAQPADALLEVLDTAWAASHPLAMVGGHAAESCADGSCGI